MAHTAVTDGIWTGPELIVAKAPAPIKEAPGEQKKPGALPAGWANRPWHFMQEGHHSPDSSTREPWHSLSRNG